MGSSPIIDAASVLVGNATKITESLSHAGRQKSKTLAELRGPHGARESACSPDSTSFSQMRSGVCMVEITTSRARLDEVAAPLGFGMLGAQDGSPIL